VVIGESDGDYNPAVVTYRLPFALWALAALAGAAWQSPPAVAAPEHGALIIGGGGSIGRDIVERFVALAGGKDASIAMIPTANGELAVSPNTTRLFTQVGVSPGRVTVLHTLSRPEADSESFAGRLQSATGVWFGGGRQWVLADIYLHTRTHREIESVLKRGGVVGGLSAGASFLASYLVRGSPLNNRIVMSPGHEEGLGLLGGSAIDTHVISRSRQDDLDSVLAAHPELLGIGLAEETAIVVQHGEFEVIGPMGRSRVFVHMRQNGVATSVTLYRGDRFDLKTLTKVRRPATFMKQVWALSRSR
jgi:cyanophycinase